MQRRSFIHASVVTACAAAAPLTAAERREAPVFELRTYALRTGKQPVLDHYLNKALLPALNRRDIGPVGVFVETGVPDPPPVFVLIVHPSVDSVIALSALFAGLNLAVFSLSQVRLQLEADGGNADAARVLELRKNSNQVLATVVWGNVGTNVFLIFQGGELALLYVTDVYAVIADVG